MIEYTNDDVEGARPDIDDLRTICQSGDEEAFCRLLRTLHSEGFAYARRKLQSGADADDVLQQAYINALKGFRKGQFDASKKLRPWFLTVILNAVTDFARKEDRHRGMLHIDARYSGEHSDDLDYTNLVSLDDPPSARMERWEEQQEIAARLGSLQDHHRMMLEMFMSGMKYNEIAEVLHVPVGTVKSRLNAAKKKYRDAA